MAHEEPIGLDDAEQTATDNTPAKDVDGIPYCRTHHCRMEIASGGPKGSRKAYYRCQVPKCEERGIRIKTVVEGVVPREPLVCPRCKKRQVCERDDRVSTSAMVILRCPACGWKSSALAVPQLAAADFARRRNQQRMPAEDVGRR